MEGKFNWVGVAGGAATLLLIAVSWFVPWWSFAIGSPAFVEASFSPVSLNFALFGDSFTVPLIWAMNIAVLLSLAAGGIIMLIYSIIPTKPYAKRLLSFSYNKPLYAVLFFVVELIIMVVMAKSVVGLDIPLSGSAMVMLPPSITQGTSVSVAVLAAFGWPFYFAIVVAGICVAARLLHRRVVGVTVPEPPN
jgi:hypothetical protein